MSSLVLKRITYKEFREKSFEFKDDRYGIASFITDNIRKAHLANPSNDDENKTAVYLLFDDDVVVGRELRFATRIMVNDTIVWAQSGGAMEVCEDYRKKGAGILFLLEDRKSNEYCISLGALFSTMRVELLKKQKISVFEIPQFIKIVNTRFVFESVFKLKGLCLDLISTIANWCVRLLEIPNRIRKNMLLRTIILKKETIVPEWVGKMVINDKHKYKELHDTKWFQWNLDYNYNGFPNDIQSFYSIYNKKGIPQGFFMTKERFEEEAGRYRNVIRGTIVEWGTFDDSTLSEADLNLLAISTFSPNTSHITTVTMNPNTEKRLKKMRFKNHGTFQMSFKDKTGLYADGSNQSLWRIRYGCCNSILH